MLRVAGRRTAPRRSIRAFSRSAVTLDGENVPETTYAADSGGIGHDPVFQPPAYVSEVMSTEAPQSFLHTASEAWLSSLQSVSTVIEGWHEFSHLPWWGTIITLVLGVRVLQLPISYYSMSRMNRMTNEDRAELRLAGAKLQRIMAALPKNAVLDRLRGGWAMVKTNRNLMKKNGIFYGRMLLPTLVHIPVLILVIAGTRYYVLSHAGADVGLETGGIAWFSDLAKADPYLLLPTAAAGLTYYNLHVALKQGVPKIFRPLLRFGQYATMVIFPLSTMLPAGSQLAWVTSVLFSRGMSTAQRSPAVMKALGWENLAQLRQEAQEQETVDSRRMSPRMQQSAVALMAKRGTMRAVATSEESQRATERIRALMRRAAETDDTAESDRLVAEAKAIGAEMRENAEAHAEQVAKSRVVFPLFESPEAAMTDGGSRQLLRRRAILSLAAVESMEIAVSEGSLKEVETGWEALPADLQAKIEAARAGAEAFEDDDYPGLTDAVREGLVRADEALEAKQGW